LLPRAEASVEESLIEMYLAGVSVRRVEGITEALWGTRVSPATVSNLNKKIYAKIDVWRNRAITGEHPYLYLDGIVMKRSWAGEVRNVSLLVASAVNTEGFPEILGICEGAKEDKSGWSAFLRHLVERGLKGVRLIISDACRGLVESAAEYLPDARWQRCMVHFYRNVFSHVPATKIRDVSHMLKAIHAQESRASADDKAKAITAELRLLKMGKAADLVEQSVHETLTYYAFPDIHWHKIRTNNPLERIMREIRRRTRVVGAFPDGQSCLNLAAARLRHIAGTQWSTKRYMNMRPLFQADEYPGGHGGASSGPRHRGTGPTHGGPQHRQPLPGERVLRGHGPHGALGSGRLAARDGQGHQLRPLSRRGARRIRADGVRPFRTRSHHLPPRRLCRG
jgi:putative transposase